MQDVVIVAGVRTPIGDFGGALKGLMANQLASLVIDEVIKRAGVSKVDIDEVLLGNCLQRSDEPNIARCAALRAGLPITTTGVTIQRQCSSGMEAIVSGYRQIAMGDADVIIAGGTESMSNAVYALKNARWGQRITHSQMTDTLWELLTDPDQNILMGETAERLVDKYDISREEQDEIALRSHRLAINAIDEGRFAQEIVSVPIPSRKGEKLVVLQDEHPRRELTMNDLTKLKPAFRDKGTVTAGNASGLNDGASALVLMSESKANSLGIKPLARIVGSAKAGVEPDLMGYGPVPAVKKLLKKTGLNLGDIGLMELNEAFAAQYLACEKLLELNRNIVNVNGSGVGLGHPVGSTGARLVVTLLHEMIRRDVKKGLATLCVGGGMGKAIIIEKC
jgi:acetyl-CoA C-acetyltransferase